MYAQGCGPARFRRAGRGTTRGQLAAAPTRVGFFRAAGAGVVAVVDIVVVVVVVDAVAATATSKRFPRRLSRGRPHENV